MERDDDRIRLFDDWARHYDPCTEDPTGFPFGGYDCLLEGIVDAAQAEQGMEVLDLGIGTGNLAARFDALGCEIWGIDFSAQMLARARERLPGAVLALADLLNDWPLSFQRRFDRIVSAYVLHEFELSAKIGLLQRLVKRHLVARGRIVVGDIAFPTAEVHQAAHLRWKNMWDEDEYYWVADQALAACSAVGLSVTYRQVSSCGGVFVIGPDGLP